MTDLYKTRNWRGILALEATASAAAAQLRETVPDLAAIIYRMLGCGFHRLGQTNKAIGLCEQGLALAEDAGYRACTGMICDSPSEPGVNVHQPRCLLREARAVRHGDWAARQGKVDQPGSRRPRKRSHIFGRAGEVQDSTGQV